MQRFHLYHKEVVSIPRISFNISYIPRIFTILYSSKSPNNLMDIYYQSAFPFPAAEPFIYSWFRQLHFAMGKGDCMRGLNSSVFWGTLHKGYIGTTLARRDEFARLCPLVVIQKSFLRITFLLFRSVHLQMKDIITHDRFFFSCLTGHSRLKSTD